MLKRFGAFFLDILEVVVLAVAIFLLVYLLLLQPHKIKGDSMKPNFLDGEFLLTDKISYRFGEPSRGDVVVFKAPVGNGEEFIKRIIGLPGETISVKEGKVLINGTVLAESYLPDITITSSGGFLSEGKEIMVSPENFVVFGDNRSHSSDSRSWGFVSKEKITGRAWLIYWPPRKAGVVPKIEYHLGKGLFEL